MLSVSSRSPRLAALLASRAVGRLLAEIGQRALPAAAPRLLDILPSICPATLVPFRSHQTEAVLGPNTDAPPEFDEAHMRRVKEMLTTKHRLSSDEAAVVLSDRLGMKVSPGAVIDLSAKELQALLEDTGPERNNSETGRGYASMLDEALFAHAESVSRRFFGDRVFQRGIVEFSNVCENDCGYCGIRKYQPGVERYTMKKDDIVESALHAFNSNMGTLMLQSGELRSPKRMAFITDVVRDIRKATIAADIAKKKSPLNPESVSLTTEGLGLCVALSAGEMPLPELQQLRRAGASRYLVRIETSNPELFASLHPPYQTFEARVQCLKDIKAAGLQLGTGIMVGLPGQTYQDLANDLLFFKEVDADMIGMGPYIPEPNTWVAEDFHRLHPSINVKQHLQEMVELTTRMNALARITLGNVNIAATTSLQAITPLGRELALSRGANVVMPIMTPSQERSKYQLYPGKPCVSHGAEGCKSCLKMRISSVGKTLQSDGSWSDPPHFRQETAKARQPPYALRLGSIGSAPMQRPPLPVIRGSSSRLPASVNRAAHTDASAAKLQQTAKGSDCPRTNIGVFGRMNAGKSTLVNSLTRQETSIVDSTPGTTADTKIALMEFHDVGPVKIFDTAGIDERGDLGSKKAKKAMAALKETDVALVVVDLTRLSGVEASSLPEELKWESQLVSQALKYGSYPMVVLNHKGVRLSEGLAQQTLRVLSQESDLPFIETELASDDGREKATSLVQEGMAVIKKAGTVPSLPEEVLADNAVVFLNIPMDAETPSLRLLRPQALVQEEAIRHYATTIAYRMDLNAARSGDPERVNKERQRFLRALKPVLDHDGPKIIVTDSQAVDILHPWTLIPGTEEPMIPFTTFSIAMINRMSGGRLQTFVDGVSALDTLKEGDHVLVAEACNHNRITDQCNDIGMVQIPNALIKLTGGKGPFVEHAFGREYPEVEEGGGGLGRFKVAIHCGACMIDQQKMKARLLDMEEAGVPVVNYGLFLSYVQSPLALQRAIEPWQKYQ